MAAAEDDKRTSRDTAVALHYDGSDAPPEIVATGQGKLAARIREIAFQHGVRVREDADLAELLRTLEVGDQIPVEAFAAVAEILTYVYKANGEWPTEREDVVPPPDPEETT